MRKGKQVFLSFLFLLAVFLCILSTGQARAETEEQKVTVYSSWGNDTTHRYFLNSKYETNAVCKGGTWYGQYWNGNRWVTYTSNNHFSSGAHSYFMNAGVTDIPAAAPVWSKDEKNYYMYYGSGSTHYFHVLAEKGAADFQYRLFCRWNNTGEEEIFDSMAEQGRDTVSIPDPVVGYYYTINNSNGNSLNTLSSASYLESANIPFDVTQIGSYLHVRARSMGGAVGEERIIYSNFAYRCCLCTLKIQYLAMIQLSKNSLMEHYVTTNWDRSRDGKVLMKVSTSSSIFSSTRSQCSSKSFRNI